MIARGYHQLKSPLLILESVILKNAVVPSCLILPIPMSHHLSWISWLKKKWCYPLVMSK
jgi:hypothetical protein